MSAALQIFNASGMAIFPNVTTIDFTHAGERHSIYLRPDDPAIERVSELVGHGEVDEVAFTELNLLVDLNSRSGLGRPTVRMGFW